MSRRPPIPTLFPYTTLFRSERSHHGLRSTNEPCSRCSHSQPDPSGTTSPSTRTSSTSSGSRSEEHTSELQSPCNLVCRLLLEKKKTRDVALKGTPRRNDESS